MDARLHLSTDEEVLSPVCDFTYSWCISCGLAEDDALRFTIAVSELITDIILFAYPQNSRAFFDIKFRHSLSSIELIVSEAGEPFDPDRHRYNARNALQYDNFEGAGFRLIRRFCDDFLFINKGKEGKEFHLIKELNTQQIDKLLAQFPSLAQAELELEDEQEADGVIAQFDIKKITPEDAEDISKLIYRTYEYSYPKEDMYFPKKVEETVLGKEKLGAIARSSDGEAVGYFALLKKQDATIAEIGEAVVSPEYRRKGVMSRMMKRLIKIAGDQKLDALFGKAITIHPVSQKVNHKYGFKSTALMLGVTNPLSVKGFDGDYPQPISELIDFLPISKPKHRTVYIPEQYETIIMETYEIMEMEVTIGKRPASVKMAKKSNIDLSVDSFDNNATIVVKQYGSDFKTILTDMLESLMVQEKNLNSIYLDLPLENSAPPSQFNELDSLGFIYCGLLPLFYDEADFIRMQKNIQPLNLDLITVHFEFGKKIKSLIANEYHTHTNEG
jgi:anti-sigma regulatory factor (Ser/Thr protein kinase)/N-acetylglutamate synthase-like GNAT family acetyltransferase